KEVLGIAANVIAVVEISVKILQVCSQYGQDVTNVKADVAELQQEVETLYDTAKKVKTLIEGSQGAKLKASQDFALKITETLSLLSKVDAKLQPPAKSSVRQHLGLKSLKWPFESGQVHLVVQRIRRCSESLSLALQVDEITLLFEADIKLDQTGSKIDATHSKLDKTHHRLDGIYSKLNKPDDSLGNGVTKIPKVDDRLDIAALPLAVGAAYSSFAEQDNSICIQSTRSEILQEINYWLDGDNSETVFWLQGMAGTGKSTVARTVATRWDKRNHLGASFFFKRGGGDGGNLSYFYKPVASQMAISIPNLSESIKAAIDSDLLLTSKMAEEQFDKLILQRLLKLQPTDRRVTAIIIDASDEFDGAANIKRLLNILN
uniref:Nephrocystin 3-like N-terminal domain-containing protein n=1 Tax=Fusarium oxysporum (strain Fo5176) TaxID=660025 RepID=A0A0D2XTW7_FUSOF